MVLLDSLVFFFCWVAEGFRSSCSSGSGAAGSRWSASELPLLVLGLSSSDLCLSLDILMKLLLGKLGRPPGPLPRRYGVGEGERKIPFLKEMEAAGGGEGGGGKKRSRGGSGRGVWNIESRRGLCSAGLRPEGGAAQRLRKTREGWGGKLG